MINYRIKLNNGFIALMSVVIISVLLLGITLTISLTGFFGRFNILDSESKERSVALAEACGDTAILNFTNDHSYDVSFASPETVTVSGSDQCKIMMFKNDTPTTGKALIKTQAFINKAYTNIKIQINTSDMTIDSWEECSNLTSAASSC